MKCPLCNVEARIQRTYTKVVGDTSPETETKVYTAHDFVCRNKQCSNYEKVFQTVENEIPHE
jgi:hypothetical protein